jgi:hypothetical protein
VCELATGAADASGWSMLYDVCSTGSREFANRNELVDVVSATDDRDSKLIQKQERNTVAVVAVESRLTVLALDRRIALDVVRSRPTSIYWRHTERCTKWLRRHTGKLLEHSTVAIASSALNQSTQARPRR